MNGSSRYGSRGGSGLVFEGQGAARSRAGVGRRCERR
jgi:hypothetical protein